jgi:hypothetical protein
MGLGVKFLLCYMILSLLKLAKNWHIVSIIGKIGVFLMGVDFSYLGINN